MDKNRLYYQLPYVKTFMCTVESCTKGKKGNWEVTLNQTGFYPEGGGQPSDIGTLNGIPVLYVREKGEQVIHELPERWRRESLTGRSAMTICSFIQGSIFYPA